MTATTPLPISIDDVHAAAARLDGVAHRTPVVTSRTLDARTPRVLQSASVFGRVPLFYFVLHLPLIHLLAVIACYAMNGAVHWLFESPTLAVYPFTPPPVWGLSLPWIYLLWVVVVVSLYPACAWFASVKQRRREWWLSYS